MIIFFPRIKGKSKRETECGEGEFGDNKNCGVEKEESGYVKVGAKVFVFMSFREKVMCRPDLVIFS